jgi:hypothetical protein
MYIKLNGPPIEEFNFDTAVKLWLNYAPHRLGTSAGTTMPERQRALLIQSFP